MQRQWRLIYDKPAIGAINMAVDEAILWSVSVGLTPPTLRLYAWNPPCLSLGYAQRIADVDLHRAEQLGWHIVRRPTGGRAILHTNELTYSIAVPLGHPLAAGSVVDSYRRISRALITALHRLGISPQADKRADNYKAAVGPVCFEVPSHYEITVNGRKLIGSAQVRRRNGILQHGTLPLYGDIARICDVLAFENECARMNAKSQVLQRATTLEAAIGRVLSWNEVAQAIVEGFSQTFDVELQQGALIPEEQTQVEHYLQTIYGTQSWTHRR